MSLSTAHRAPRLIRRYVSKATTQSVAVPPQKMRALIDLYHQTETFITKQNLSQRIDEAFFPKEAIHLGGAASLRRGQEVSTRELQQRLKTRDSLPKYADWSVVSAGHSARERAVTQALFGTATHDGKPGLEALEEDAERTQKQSAVDREHARMSR